MEEDKYWLPPYTGETNPFNLLTNGERKVFKIDVGNIPEDEIEDYIRKVANKYKMAHANYMQVVPDSHFWTDLNQILESIKHHYYLMEAKPKENEYISEPYLTKEYILIGLNNSKMNGYYFKLTLENVKKVYDTRFSIFADFDEMVEFIKSRTFELKYDYEDFETIIKNTLDCGINLTNGLKMERKEIYNRIDGERTYQDERWGSRRQMDGTPDEEKPVAEWINYIEYHVSKAKERVYHLDTLGATAELRKVAALAVRAMEIHGCPERDLTAFGTPIKVKEVGCDGKNCDCQK